MIAQVTQKTRPSGLRLLEALFTPQGIDRYLELAHPVPTVRDLRDEVTNVHRTTADTVTPAVRPTRQWRGFTSGQFVRVSVEVGGVRRTRCHSPAASQHAGGAFELIVKAHEQGLVSRRLHANARPGLVLHLAQAAGPGRAVRADRRTPPTCG